VVSFTLRLLYPRGKSPQYPLDRKLRGPQSRSGRHAEIKILALTGTRNRTPWSSSPVASRYIDCARRCKENPVILKRDIHGWV
jgi:hypothetical protein